VPLKQTILPEQQTQITNCERSNVGHHATKPTIVPHLELQIRMMLNKDPMREEEIGVSTPKLGFVNTFGIVVFETHEKTWKTNLKILQQLGFRNLILKQKAYNILGEKN